MRIEFNFSEQEKAEGYARYDQLLDELIAKGIDPVSGIYQILDREIAPAFTDKACGKGCCACCLQTVDIALPEFAVIMQHLKRKPPTEWKDVLSIAMKRANDWYRAFGQQFMLITKLEQTMAMNRSWRGQPCPFLSPSGTCSVYAARPQVCRIFRSSIRCTPTDGRGVKCFNTVVEWWSSERIIDLHNEVAGSFFTRPIQAFLLLMARQI